MYFYYVITFLIFALTDVYAAPAALPGSISIYASLSSLIKLNCSYPEDLKLFDTKLEFLEPCKNISLSLPLDKLEVDNIHQPLCLIYYNSFQQLCFESGRLSENELKHNNALSKISFYKSNVSHVCEILKGSFLFKNSTLDLKENFTHDAILEPALSTISKFFKNKKCARLCTDLDDRVLFICVYAAIMTEQSKVISQNTVNNGEHNHSKKMYSSSLKTDIPTIIEAQKLQGNDNLFMSTSTPKNEPQDGRSLQKLENNKKIHEVPLSGSSRGAISIDSSSNNQSEVTKTLPAHKADKSQPEILARPSYNSINIEVMVTTSESPRYISVGTSNKEPSIISTDELNKAQKQLVENQPRTDSKTNLIDKVHELISSSTEIPQPEPTNMKMQRNEPDDFYSDLDDEVKSQTKSKPSETVEDSRNFSANYQNQNIDDSDSYFFSYFMMACLVFIFAYVAYHNKQKILALVVEGRKGRRSSRTRRPNSANYRKLDTNLEEAVTSSCSKSATTHVIY